MKMNFVTSTRFFLFFVFPLLCFHSVSIASDKPDPKLVDYYSKIIMAGETFYLQIKKEYELKFGAQAIVSAVAEALKTNETLTKLSINSIKIGDAEAQALSEALKINNTLTWLYLSRNQISDAGAQAISEALRINKTLTWLYLNTNQIGNAGAQAISKALGINNTLTLLNLNSNKIGNAGAEAISEALKINNTLTSLDLSDNQISDAGAEAISKALMINNTLTFLHLCKNQIFNKNAESEIEQQLDINKRLPEILLASWPKVKHLFMGYNDAGSLLGELPKELIIKILGTFLDIETLSTKR